MQSQQLDFSVEYFLKTRKSYVYRGLSLPPLHQKNLIKMVLCL